MNDEQKQTATQVGDEQRRRMITQRVEFDHAAELAEQYRRITMTPIVDDDYPEVRSRYEGAVYNFLRACVDNGRTLPGQMPIVESREESRVGDLSHITSVTIKGPIDPAFADQRGGAIEFDPVRRAMRATEVLELANKMTKALYPETYGRDMKLMAVRETIRHLLTEAIAIAERPAGLTLDALREVNVTRCGRWHIGGVDDWSPSDWAVAIAGELGEMCSLVKMMNRERDGMTGNKFRPTINDVAKEAADVLIYLDLFCARLGINLGEAARNKFNEVSERNGFPDRLL